MNDGSGLSVPSAFIHFLFTTSGFTQPNNYYNPLLRKPFLGVVEVILISAIST